MKKRRRRQKIDIRDVIAIILIIIILLMIGGYMVYDMYFRLPTSSFSPTSDSNSAEEDELIGERFNILLLGLDGRAGLNDRSDTLILASLDQKNKKAQLLSIPRDTRVKIKGNWDKINAAYAYGGVELSKQTVADFLGVNIDRYVIINFEGLVKLVDEIGGIEVDVPVRMYKPLEGIDLQPGLQLLNGEEVLAYSRFRDTKGGDLDRSRRQQEVIKLIAQKVLEERNINQIMDFIEIAREDIRTDLTGREIGALVRLASPIMENGLATKLLPGSGKYIDNIWYYLPDLTKLEELLLIS